MDLFDYMANYEKGSNILEHKDVYTVVLLAAASSNSERCWNTTTFTEWSY